MTVEEYKKEFMNLLKYVPYISEENMKVGRFISGLNETVKGQIKTLEPRALEEAIRKARCCENQWTKQQHNQLGWKNRLPQK